MELRHLRYFAAVAEDLSFRQAKTAAWETELRLAEDQVQPAAGFVVGGFTEGKGSRKHLGALLLGLTGTGDSTILVIQGADSLRKG